MSHALYMEVIIVTIIQWFMYLTRTSNDVSSFMINAKVGRTVISMLPLYYLLRKKKSKRCDSPTFLKTLSPLSQSFHGQYLLSFTFQKENLFKINIHKNFPLQNLNPRPPEL